MGGEFSSPPALVLECGRLYTGLGQLDVEEKRARVDQREKEGALD